MAGKWDLSDDTEVLTVASEPQASKNGSSGAVTAVKKTKVNGKLSAFLEKPLSEETTNILHTKLLR